MTPTSDPEVVYVNGIDPETGALAVPPVSLVALAESVRAAPGGAAVAGLRGEVLKSFAPPFGVDLEQLAEAGWAVVFAEDTPADVRAALAPLIEHRRKQAGPLCKTLDHKKGEQARDWYTRHQVAVGTLEPESVPYYLLLVGQPTQVPFEFQYLLGVEYAVGRLALDTAADYAAYARSVVAYETAAGLRNAREIVYWGTRHPADPATNLSASFLIEPLANGLAGATGSLKRPIHADAGYERRVYSDDEATKERLLGTFTRDRPPAVLFTASHGMALKPGRPNQLTDQGGLICQDWPGYGTTRPEHYLAAADLSDGTNVSGVVAFLFACFGAGTPDTDQFVKNLADAGAAAPAPEPFVAALPRRLLSHPNGGALAVIGHVDRAWGFSIRPVKSGGPAIGPFRNCLGYVLTGTPVGHAVGQQFGQRYAALSADLLTATAPTAPPHMRLSDRDLVNYWLQRNDAQNYVILGDPAVRVRKDALA